jgi:hypothetical protein
VKTLVEQAVKAIPAPKDGKDADPEEIAKMVKAAVDALPKPQDGKSVTLADVQPVLDEAIQRMQKDVNAAVERVLAESKTASELVQKSVEAIRQPEDGRSVTVDDVAPIIKAEVEKAVAAIPAPKDGAGVAGAMIDRDGNLNLTMSNGEVKNLGRVEGKDGVDGISLDAFEMEYLPETHEVSIKAVCAGRAKELRYPAGGIRPAGYWRDGSKAKAGDVWTRNGSMWIAKRDTSASPEPKSEDWYLAVQKGRDGESIVKTVREGPEPPIPLKGEK